MYDRINRIFDKLEFFKDLQTLENDTNPLSADELEKMCNLALYADEAAQIPQELTADDITKFEKLADWARNRFNMNTHEPVPSGE